MDGQTCPTFIGIHQSDQGEPLVITQHAVAAAADQLDQSLITCCPSLSSEYQSIALGIIDKTCPQEGGDPMRGAKSTNRAASGTVARVDGEHGDDPLIVASTTFASTPYAVFCERRAAKGGGSSMRSLLSAQYGYDVGEARDKAQALSETQKWLGKEILHVGRIRSLVVGPRTSRLSRSGYCGAWDS